MTFDIWPEKTGGPSQRSAVRTADPNKGAIPNLCVTFDSEVDGKEPEQEEPPPELDVTPPPISLEALEMSLNPGTGGSLAGDFALPGFNVNQKELGGLDIFDIGDVDEKPQAQKQAQPRYPSAARRTGKEGFVVAEFIIDATGATTEIQIKQSSDPIFNQPTIEAIRKWRFTPGKKGNRVVKTRTRVKLPFQLN